MTIPTTLDDSPATDTGESAPPGRTRRILVTVLAVLAVLSVLAALGAGFYWWSGTHSTAASVSQQRDEAADAAEQIVVNINTIRPGSLDRDLATAQGSLTEPMLTEYGKVRQQFADALRQTKADVQVSPAGVALTAFDAQQGTASALVAIDVTASSSTTPPTQKQQLFQIEILRTPEGWKAAKAAPATAQS